MLKVVDDELYQHFMSQEPPLVSASYGMQYILSLSGCTPPLEEGKSYIYTSFF